MRGCNDAKIDGDLGGKHCACCPRPPPGSAAAGAASGCAAHLWPEPFDVLQSKRCWADQNGKDRPGHFCGNGERTHLFGEPAGAHAESRRIEAAGPARNRLKNSYGRRPGKLTIAKASIPVQPALHSRCHMTLQNPKSRQTKAAPVSDLNWRLDRARQLDREADAETFFGHVSAAERLAHQAEALRAGCAR